MANHLTEAEATVRMPEAHGVRHIFEFRGDTKLQLDDARARSDHDMTHFLTPGGHDAACMADGHARVAAADVFAGAKSAMAICGRGPVIAWAEDQIARIVLPKIIGERLVCDGPAPVDLVLRPPNESAAPVSEWIA